MTDKYQKLHLANSMDDLKRLAKPDNLSKFSEPRLWKVLKILYDNSKKGVLDQESTFILLHRYIVIYENLSQRDNVYTEVRYRSDYTKVLLQYKETIKSLEERYAKAASGDKHQVDSIEEEKGAPTTPQRIFHDEFISCEQLFSALQEKQKILLVDARPEYDYMQSRIIDQHKCINIPDQCIRAGLSAHVLGKKLPKHTQEIWEERDSYDAIVLFDWNSDIENISLTKLSKLWSALVEWDLNRKYKERPVVLNGGYLGLLHTYPTISTNPHVYLQQQNTELDELLEIDNIAYPTESDNKSQVMGVPELRSEQETPRDGGQVIEHSTKEALIKENKEITLNRQNVITQLFSKENEWNKINDMLKHENSSANVAALEDKDMAVRTEIACLQKLLQDLNKKKDDVRRKFDSRFEYDPEDESKNEDLKEITMIEDVNVENMTILQVVAEERNKALEKARALKPRLPGGKSINLDFKEPERPVINRATKPNTAIVKPKVEALASLTNGLIGLRNIRNTCYMNTVIQCMKSIPVIKSLFCKGSYASETLSQPAAIIHETASLIRQLWSKPVKFIEPLELFEKVGVLEVTYKLGNHEDCMEFFLFLLNHLSDDCSYDINQIHIMTPMQRAWYNQFEGKYSVFIDFFYHQIRITQICPKCHVKTFKFEIESTFMLSVPEHDFYLKDLMDDYMADFVIEEYCCAKCKKPVSNKKEFCHKPKILVTVLKRYRQVVLNGSVTLKKIESRAHFKTNFHIDKDLYKLNAIAMHSGDMNFGHYTAAALTPNGWHEFNDDMVRPININDDSLKAKACAFFYSMCDE